MSSRPSSPGGMVLGSTWAEVQPHEVETVSILRSPWPVLRTGISVVATSPCWMAPKSWRSNSTAISGCPRLHAASSNGRVAGSGMGGRHPPNHPVGAVIRGEISALPVADRQTALIS